jgi:hypothetical protein
LSEQTESKSSEIPVLFMHMRLPCSTRRVGYREKHTP